MSPLSLYKVDFVVDIIPKKGGQCSFYCKLPKNKGFIKKKVIEVSNLTKEYKGKKAVDNLSFDVYEGEILGLLGPNGSGKSTTINSILALLKYQGGSIKIFGEEMKPDSYDIKAKIGVIFQDVAVFNELNIYDNINYFCGL